MSSSGIDVDDDWEDIPEIDTLPCVRVCVDGATAEGADFVLHAHPAGGWSGVAGVIWEKGAVPKRSRKMYSSLQ